MRVVALLLEKRLGGAFYVCTCNRGFRKNGGSRALLACAASRCHARRHIGLLVKALGADPKYNHAKQWMIAACKLLIENMELKEAVRWQYFFSKEISERSR